ncbi:hypothetical protein BDV12DRAFT_184431 [Aspergillus spectabilis]
MAYSGLPRKSYLYYAKRRERHLANGPTLPLYALNTNISAASLRGKLNRTFTAADVKAWFDWIKDNFNGSIKSHRTLANYWRVLKRLYYLKNRKEMDSDMRRDCINIFSTEIGLWKLPLPKPIADFIDLLEFQVTHLVHCDLVFADEKQQLYPLVSLNLSSISACHAVSLFDTRHAVNPRPDGIVDPPVEEMATKDKHELSSTHSLSNRSSSNSGYETGISGDHSEMEELMDDDELNRNYDIDAGYTSESSSVTDNSYLAGNKETSTILWRHVKFYIIRNPVPGRRNLLTAIVTLLHTKGEDRKPRIKRFVIEHKDNLLFDLLSQLLALGIDNNIFVATIRDVADIYTLDLPIFREPEHTDEGYRMSDLVLLKARTWARYIKRIGKKTGQKENLTQKEVRRGAINAINNQAPASVRDQVADYEPNAVKYYLNEKVDFDTAAAFHKQASNEIVQREMWTVILVADNTALICLTDEQSRKISNHPKIRRLREICQQLTSDIHQLGITYEDNLRGEKNNQQNPLLTLNHYFIPEQEEAVCLLCYSPAPQTDEEAHLRQLDFIRLMVWWQYWKENPRRGKQDNAVVSQPDIAEKYDPLQYPFCLSDQSLPPIDREKKKSKRNKLWDHVENMHKLELTAFDSGVKPCGLCGMRSAYFVPPSVTHFKNHTQKVHGI